MFNRIPSLTSMKKIFYTASGAAQFCGLSGRIFCGENILPEILAGIALNANHPNWQTYFDALTAEELSFGIFIAGSLESMLTILFYKQGISHTLAIKHAASLVSFACFAVGKTLELAENNVLSLNRLRMR